MGKSRKPKGIIIIKGGEFHLPEPIIHRIQFFLTGKEAAQTTILSKSWHSAWLTRPDLYFDEGDFLPQSSYFYSKIDEFLNFAKMTIQRYEQSNLKIETLRLSISRSISYDSSARDLIVRALRIGSTHLSLQIVYDFVLPREVFESGNLVELSVEGGTIYLEMDQKVTCPKLESLSISKSKIRSETVSKIISSCPLIKNLSLSSFQRSEYQIECLINLPKSHELMRCLVLCKVKIDDISFLADLSSNFPSLEDLTLDYCGNDELYERLDIYSAWRYGAKKWSDGNGEICSRSLLRLTLIGLGKTKIKFDVPSLQKFTFDGSDFPSLSFETTSREWESHVSINRKMPPVTLGFSGLERILTDLRGSKIHISLSRFSDNSLNCKPRDIHGLSKLQVENVTMDLLPSSSCCALFPGLFKLCRPKFITRKFYPEKTSSCKMTKNSFLCLTRESGMSEEFSSLSNFMNGVHGLEEVNMELYDEDVAAWRSLPLESLLDGSTIPKEIQIFRFQLKWKQ